VCWLRGGSYLGSAGRWQAERELAALTGDDQRYRQAWLASNDGQLYGI
jgi:hypothetical protein